MDLVKRLRYLIHTIFCKYEILVVKKTNDDQLIFYFPKIVDICNQSRTFVLNLLKPYFFETIARILFEKNSINDRPNKIHILKKMSIQITNISENITSFPNESHTFQLMQFISDKFKCK